MFAFLSCCYIFKRNKIKISFLNKFMSSYFLTSYLISYSNIKAWIWVQVFGFGIYIILAYFIRIFLEEILNCSPEIRHEFQDKNWMCILKKIIFKAIYTLILNFVLYLNYWHVKFKIFAFVNLKDEVTKNHKEKEKAPKEEKTPAKNHTEKEKNHQEEKTPKASPKDNTGSKLK